MLTIVVFSAAFPPGFKAGGPAISVSRIVDGDTEREFRVITRSHDEGETKTYSGFSPRKWQHVGRARVSYMRSGIKDLAWIVRQIHRLRPDAYYLNSLHNPYFTILPLLAIKFQVLPRKTVVLAPRGETSQGALNIKKAKKLLWRPFIKWLLGQRLTWHFSSELEVTETINWWGANFPSGHDIVVQSNPTVAPWKAASPGPMSGTPVVTFASRIDRKKGLDEAIRILASSETQVEFRIYGVVSDDQYWSYCLGLANKLLPQNTLRYLGPYRPHIATDLFAKSSVFLFPTKGENFGHVVAEALSVGCPVMIPPTTPWTPTILAGGGHIIQHPDSSAAFLRRIVEASAAETLMIRSAALTSYEQWFLNNGVSKSLFADVTY